MYHYVSGKLGMTLSGSFTREKSRFMAFFPAEAQHFLDGDIKPWRATRAGFFVDIETGKQLQKTTQKPA